MNRDNTKPYPISTFTKIQNPLFKKINVMPKIEIIITDAHVYSLVY